MATSYRPTSSSSQKKKSGLKMPLAQEQIKQMKDCFDVFDKNGNGLIDIKDLTTIMKGLGCDTEDKQIKKRIKSTDKRKSEKVDLSEFLIIMTQKLSKMDSKDDILKAFQQFDDDCTGKISFKNLKRVAKELGEKLTDEELKEMIDEADQDGDGEVNEQEFLRVMKKTNLY